MEKIWKKKSTKAALAVIVILVAVIIIGFSTQSSQRRKDYNEHITVAEKYLSELDYEQAIVEYTLALEIEPNSEEILSALEQTYLAYAQTFADEENYEQAIDILEKGYAQTGKESLLAKKEEFTDLLTQAQSKAIENEKRLAAEEEETERQRQLTESLEMEQEPSEGKKSETATEYCIGVNIKHVLFPFSTAYPEDSYNHYMEFTINKDTGIGTLTTAIDLDRNIDMLVSTEFEYEIQEINTFDFNQGICTYGEGEYGGSVNVLDWWNSWETYPYAFSKMVESLP